MGVLGLRLVLAFTVGGLAGCGRDDADAPRAPAAPPEVDVVVVQPEDVELPVEVLATVDGYVNAEIRARVPGFVLSQDYQEGRLVEAGAPLFTIDPELTQADETRARGDYAAAKAALEKARLDERRTKELAKQGAVSRQDLDDARAAVDLARGEVTAARGALETARTNLGYTVITSPITGIAGIAQVRVGTLVGQGDPTLLTTVSQIDPVRVTFALSEQAYLANADRLRDLVMDPASERAAILELVLPDGSVHPEKGRLELIDRAVDPTTGTIRLQALYPNPELTLRPGLHVKVRARRRMLEDVLLVPQRAITELQGTQQLAVVGEGDVVEVRTVELGDRLGQRRIVQQGLAAGDRVVVEGLQKLQDGMVVSVRATKAQPGPRAQPGPAGEGQAVPEAEAAPDAKAGAGAGR